jgi:hypothetical protein
MVGFGRSLPDIRLSQALESSHTGIWGDIGMGKSTAIRQYLWQIQARGETAVVYDPHREFLPQFYDPSRGDVVLNPIDARSAGWSPGDELPASLTPAQLSAETLTIAKSFFPARPNDLPFFADTITRLFAECLKDRPTGRQLADRINDKAELERIVKGTSSEESIAKGAPQQRSGVIADLNRVADALRLLPEGTPQRWSAAEWAKRRQGWIFVTSTPQTRERLRPLTSLWLDLIILQLMTGDEAPAEKTWLVLNEVATLQRLPQFYAAITENRKSNNPIIFDVQGRSQIQALYGDLSEVLLSSPAVKMFFRNSDPKAAEWMADAIGKHEIKRLKESRTSGDRDARNQSLDLQVEYLVLPSQIMGLPRLHGYVLTDNYLVPFGPIQIFDLPKRCAGYVPRTAPPVRQPIATAVAQF